MDTFFNNLYDQIRITKENEKIKYKIKNKNKTYNIPSTLNEIYYIGDEIFNYIKNNTIEYENYETQFYYKNNNLLIINWKIGKFKKNKNSQKNKKNKKNKKIISNFSDILCYTLNFINKINNIEAWINKIKLKDLQITYYPTPFPKIYSITELYKNINLIKKNGFTPEYVNSGVTIINGTSKEIYIFREDECLKVLVHEFIHSLDLDNGFQSHIFKEEQEQILNIKNYALISESFTEGLTQLIYFSYLTLIYKFNNNMFNLLFNIEYIYQIYLSNKILEFYHKLGIYDVKNIFNKKNMNPLIQKTSVFHYYIYRPFITLNSYETINYIRKLLNPNTNTSDIKLYSNEWKNLLIKNLFINKLILNKSIILNKKNIEKMYNLIKLLCTKNKKFCIENNIKEKLHEIKNINNFNLRMMFWSNWLIV
jgi:hypothetical protein